VAVGQTTKGRRRGGQKRRRVRASEAERRRGGQTPEAIGAVGHVPSGGVARTSEASGWAGHVAGLVQRVWSQAGGAAAEQDKKHVSGGG
jgi:hypothetical protein